MAKQPGAALPDGRRISQRPEGGSAEVPRLLNMAIPAAATASGNWISRGRTAISPLRNRPLRSGAASCGLRRPAWEESSRAVDRPGRGDGDPGADCGRCAAAPHLLATVPSQKTGSDGDRRRRRQPVLRRRRTRPRRRIRRPINRLPRRQVLRPSSSRLPRVRSRIRQRGPRRRRKARKSASPMFRPHRRRRSARVRRKLLPPLCRQRLRDLLRRRFARRMTAMPTSKPGPTPPWPAWSRFAASSARRDWIFGAISWPR